MDRGSIAPIIRGIGWALAAAIAAPAQTPLSLEQAGSRTGADQRLLHDGKSIRVEGQVSSRAILFGPYAHLPIRDSKGFSLMVEAPDFMLERVSPGDVLDVTGLLNQHWGLPVLRPAQITTLSHISSPPPASRTIAQLQTNAVMGLYAITEGRVIALGEDNEGEYLLIEDGQPEPYRVYLPRAARRLGSGLGRFRVGDRVRVTGVASQATPEPPYSGGFRMELAEAASVELMERNWLVSPQALLGVAITGWMVALVWFQRHRRLTARRRALRRIHGFCEELLTVSSLEDLCRKLRNVGPRALQVSAVELYRYERGPELLRKTLSGDDHTVAVNLEKNGGKPDVPVALCFRNRTPMNISDTRRSLFFQATYRASFPRSVVLLPMFAREELLGVLELSQLDRARSMTGDELAAMQHLANQTAMVWKLLERQARREQMLQSEKLAATGQIISGVASELKGPLESIMIAAHRMLDHGDPDARALLKESLRASSILARLNQVTQLKEEESGTVEINSILSRVVEELRKDFARQELRVEVALANEPLWILGPERQIEQLLKNLVLLAARSARNSLERSLRVESILRGKRVMATVRYGALLCDESFPANGGAQDQEALAFNVCRGILHSMGGDVRIVSAGESSCLMEIQAPAAFPAAEVAAQAERPSHGRVLTALLLEPDAVAARRLVSYWSGRGHRAVPVHNEAEAEELLRRLRIDAIFCAVRFGATSWVEIFDRVHDLTPAFVLLTEGLESDAASVFPDGDGLVLRKPLEAGEMDRLLEQIEIRAEKGAPAAQ